MFTNRNKEMCVAATDVTDHWRTTQQHGFLIDLDGTLVSTGHALPGAAELLAVLKDRFVVVSNDAEHTPEELSDNLKTLGLLIAPDRIILAGSVAIDILATERSQARLLLLGSRSLANYARRRGFDVIPTEMPRQSMRPDIVLVARDRDFSYTRLTRAANAVRHGAELVATNPDFVHPGMAGNIVPETGALLRALLACTGPVPCRVIGKPEPALFLAGLERLEIDAAQATMIGDNPTTDGAGAVALGMRYLQVEGGNLSSLACTPLMANSP